ncbi:hypothetical protein QF030_007883 [Streptomyces rishiriensis]|uniref:Uncharacterized protein n=1 Tax=Streptomyces rishiriensis TaxID=68264 RepID=A0ABU0P2T7_STRRH|nr:hypothetical protein [Streptomyces rishiriensis]
MTTSSSTSGPRRRDALLNVDDIGFLKKGERVQPA